MFNVSFENLSGKTIKMGHLQSNITVYLNGIDGIVATVNTSQGFGQVGQSVDSVVIGTRNINVSGKMFNFEKSTLNDICRIFSPGENVRIHFESKYWIDCVVTSSPVFSYSGVVASFAVSLVAPYPYWKSEHENSVRLGELSSGFNFPVSYSTPHNFGIYSDVISSNCINRGNAKTDYVAKITCYSKSMTGVQLVNLENNEYIKINEPITSGETIFVFRENNTLRITKQSGNTTTNVFSSLDENSNLFFLYPGDNPIRADSLGGEGSPVVYISYYDVLTGVQYGV